MKAGAFYGTTGPFIDLRLDQAQIGETHSGRKCHLKRSHLQCRLGARRNPARASKRCNHTQRLPLPKGALFHCQWILTRTASSPLRPSVKPQHISGGLSGLFPLCLFQSDLRRRGWRRRMDAARPAHSISNGNFFPCRFCGFHIGRKDNAQTPIGVSVRLAEKHGLHARYPSTSPKPCTA